MQMNINSTAIRLPLLSIALIVCLAPVSEAQRSSRPDTSSRSQDKPAAFATSISDLQPVLLKNFTADSADVQGSSNLSAAAKDQQKELAVREIGQRIYNRMIRRGFSVYSFERTPTIARENMRDAIVVEGTVDEVKVGEKRPEVTVTIKAYPYENPGKAYAEVSMAGKIQKVANNLTRSFGMSAGHE